MRKFLMVLGLTLATSLTYSQSKVFKEVGEDISSQMKTISQDDALIGYLVFTQLERVSSDSFNYKVTILDENLNDIGALNFRERNLSLQSVSFESDILCLAYLKSDLTEQKGTSLKNIKRTLEGEKNYVFTQHINLQGQIVGTSSNKITLKPSDAAAYYAKHSSKAIIPGTLKHDILLKNLPGKGFIVFYGDETSNRMVALNLNGKELWEKKIPEGEAFDYLTNGDNLYLLSKIKNESPEGGYEIKAYSLSDGKNFDKYVLKDKKGNQFKVVGFEKDPVTGNPIVTGQIINSLRPKYAGRVADIKNGAYIGFFALQIKGPNKADYKPTFSYWNEGKSGVIAADGKFTSNNSYANVYRTVRDYSGNTYFIGSFYTHKPRWPAIILSPLFLGATILNGTHRSQATDGMILKMDTAGKIKLDNSIEVKKSAAMPSRFPIGYYDRKSYHVVTNSVSQNNFLIIDQSNEAVIYNLEKRKVIRRVPHRDANLATYIFPAKEGHIMVMQHNRRERETRMSIEAL